MSWNAVLVEEVMRVRMASCVVDCEACGTHDRVGRLPNVRTLPRRIGVFIEKTAEDGFRSSS